MFDLGISLNVLFWILLLTGMMIMVISSLAQGILHFGDDGSVVPSVALFLVLFGAVGVIVLATSGSDTLALVLSFIISIGVSIPAYLFFFRKLANSSVTLKDQREDLVGKTAEVSLSINPDAPGQITFTTPSGRTTAMARSIDGSSIRQGTPVEVVQCVGTTYYVRALNPGGASASPVSREGSP